MHIADGDAAAAETAFRAGVLDRLAAWGAEAGVAYAEAFKRVEEGLAM